MWRIFLRREFRMMRPWTSTLPVGLALTTALALLPPLAAARGYLAFLLFPALAGTAQRLARDRRSGALQRICLGPRGVRPVLTAWLLARLTALGPTLLPALLAPLLRVWAGSGSEAFPNEPGLTPDVALAALAALPAVLALWVAMGTLAGLGAHSRARLHGGIAAVFVMITGVLFTPWAAAFLESLAAWALLLAVLAVGVTLALAPRLVHRD